MSLCELAGEDKYLLTDSDQQQISRSLLTSVPCQICYLDKKLRHCKLYFTITLLGFLV